MYEVIERATGKSVKSFKCCGCNILNYQLAAEHSNYLNRKNNVLTDEMFYAKKVA